MADQPIAGQVPLHFVANLCVPEMIDAVKKVPADSVIFYLNYVQEIRGRTLSELQVAELVATATAAPVYGFLEMYGEVGRKRTSLRERHLHWPVPGNRHVGRTP